MKVRGGLQTLCFTPANSYVKETLYLETKFKSKRRPCRLAWLPFLVKVHEVDHKKKTSIIPFIRCQLTTRTHCTPCLRWNLTLRCGFPRIVKLGECSMQCKHLCKSLGAPERTTKTAYNYSHAEHTSIWRATWIWTVLLRLYKLGIIGTGQHGPARACFCMSMIRRNFSMAVLIPQCRKWCSRAFL